MTLIVNPKLLQKTCEEVRKSYRVCERHFAAEDKYLLRLIQVDIPS
nr:unnamed protein product [Callosobruchus analis]